MGAAVVWRTMVGQAMTLATRPVTYPRPALVAVGYYAALLHRLTCQEGVESRMAIWCGLVDSRLRPSRSLHEGGRLGRQLPAPCPSRNKEFIIRQSAPCGERIPLSIG